MTEHIEDKLIKQATKGDKDAQYALGHHYELGFRLGFDFADVDGVDPDAYWYRKAAGQGHHEAQYILGQYYRRGIGVEMDSKQSIFWFHKAADGGHVRAISRVKALTTKQ